MRIATFNVQNLRLREGPEGGHLDGARDEVVALNKLSEADKALDARDRALTARLIAEADADVLALQEVFDQRSLDHLHDALLSPLGARYPHRICVPGNDGRRHLAWMSRTPLENVRSHATLTYDDVGLTPPDGKPGGARVFRRDCVAAMADGLLLLNVHFKAPADSASLAVTRGEVLATRTIIERTKEDRWVIAGDLNVGDAASGDILWPVTREFGVDLGAAHAPQERWTYFNATYASYARPDRIVVSPALAAQRPVLSTFRQGMSRAARLHTGDRFDDVGEVRPRASDHALLAVDTG